MYPTSLASPSRARKGPNVYQHTLETMIKRSSQKPLKQWFTDCMPGELERIIAAEWKSSSEHVVLEVPNVQNPKACRDSERCTWATLLREMGEAGVTDPTVNSHELSTPITTEGRAGFLVNHCPHLQSSASFGFLLGSSYCPSNLENRSPILHHQAEGRPELLPILSSFWQWCEVFDFGQLLHNS